MYTGITANKYVIYARKSTDEKGKQEKSIDDQVYYCKELARTFGLNVVAVLTEKKSAKKSSMRPIFNGMIQSISEGHYDGIIAWHPDRLARNMGDASHIIEMIDEGVIKDARFCTQQFTNDANGKMLLGLSFVLSKQYSDKLSDDVNRGNMKRHLEGKVIGRHKLGYAVNENDEYIKDPLRWDSLREAFRMKLEGSKTSEVAEYLKKINFRNKSNKFLSAKSLHVIFKDPFYFGEMNLRGQTVVLTELYNFEPMISEEEYVMIQTNKNNQGRKKIHNFPLKGKVIDFKYPNITYFPQAIKNKYKNTYLMYAPYSHEKKKLRLVNELGKNELKAVRALKILQALEKLFGVLNSGNDEKKYEKFLKQLRSRLAKSRDQIAIEIQRNGILAKNAKQKQKNLVDNYLLEGANYSPLEKLSYREQNSELNKEIQKLEEDLIKLKSKERNIMPQYEDFSNTAKLLSESYSSLPNEYKMKIADELVSNIIVSNGNVEQIKLIEPYDKFFGDFKTCGWG